MKRLLFTLVFLLVAQTAFAQEKPTAFHVPKTEAPAEEDAWFQTELSKDWQLKTVWLAVRPLDSTEDFKRIPFKRATPTSHVAVVPAEDMQPPGVEYFIASESREGALRNHFATPETPQPVYVEGETNLTKRQARLDRHAQKTSEFELRGEYTTYGQRRGFIDGQPVRSEGGSDNMWKSEIQYTYRPLTYLYDFGFGLGIMRGAEATVLQNGESVPFSPLSDDEPGLNYGFGTVTFEADRNFSTTARLTLGASTKGFAIGAGLALRIGRIAGTNLELGADLVQDIGNRYWMAFAWDTVPNVLMSLTFEANTQPNPNVNPTGLRFIYEAGWQLNDSVTLLGDIGYATRTDGLTVGIVGGVKAKYQF